MPTHSRTPNVAAAQWSPNGGALGQADLTQPSANVYGANVFSIAVQRQRLPKAVFRQLEATVAKGNPLEPALADAVASAMREWAMERGATHYTHWFQPLTGSTAEKHDSFYGPTGDGNAIAEFSGKELIQGEPDASSFPSGGIRSTFEARGYTAWDPSSPAFILENPNGALLCIPTAFTSWSGEALDNKIPLLRSMDALSRSAIRALGLLGETAEHVFTTVGAEQEYFLIDEQYYFERPDLLTTGRTLFGAKPPKGQELDDHYFGSIPERVLAYMLEVEQELAKLGVPIKTRHNEVAPAQYEVAPIFENSNIGADHQQITMQVLQNVARRYGLVCLLHEKPFAGINGSGKHNNWSMGTDTGINLLDPGDTPHENLLFLFFCSAVLKAVNAHQALLRASVANAGQDHRLGANEAPPAIISIFLGAELEKAFGAIESGSGDAATPQAYLEMGASVLPRLPLHGGDRNRTSPFAFTGNKFEFRALGSSMSLGMPNTILNTIAAQAIDQLADLLEEATSGGTSIEEAVLAIVKQTWSDNKRIVFSGDGYSDDWHAEAEARGLINLRQSPDALPWLVEESTVSVFSKYNVLSERELEARFEVAVEQYVTTINIEGETAAAIARTSLLPAAVRWLGTLKEVGVEKLVAETSSLVDAFIDAIFALETANRDHPEGGEGLEEAKYVQGTVLPAMNAVREVADKLEKIVPDDLWPLPKYSEILFIK
ncbi:glutamine synthetase III [Solirubrobacter phytolaccae]|uniref:Glutamine synthetase III n=1 Tax=Solirubrobacter phytolaccae TaxID=1404360 RepID=A0A9X3NBC3_9ACTN|nr:glutamine synthetase III [Solirubrobacter phytolaccae]MDA0180881.1 glutamine synthetase III [Solirubrobacter phytolaccae]